MRNARHGKSYSILLVGLLLAFPVLARPQNANPSQSGSQPSQTQKKQNRPWCMHHCDSSREKAYDLNNRTYSGETIRGPVTIVAKNLNILRYKYSADSKVTISKPPDLWSQLTNLANPQSSTPSQPTTTAAAGGNIGAKSFIRVAGTTRVTVGGKATTPAGEAVYDKVKKADDEALQATTRVDEATSELNAAMKASLDADLAKASSLVARANAATDSVNVGGQELVSFLKSVSSSSTYAELQKELANNSTFLNGVNATWPPRAEVGDLKNSVDQRKTVLGQLKSVFEGQKTSLITDLNTAQRDLFLASEALESFARTAPTQPGDQSVITDGRTQITLRLSQIHASNLQLNAAANFLNSALAANDQMETSLSSLDYAGDKYKAFQQAQAQLQDWQKQMSKVKSDWENYTTNPAQNGNPFEMRIAGTCDYAFASTKQTAITLTATDQLPDKTAASPATVLSVTIECASPFNVSAGVAFSTLPNKEFAIHPVATPPGSTTTTNEFVLTANSSFHPLALGMVSARLCEPNEKVAFHLSFGLAGNFKSQDAGGSSAEFLIGPSISLFRTMFITPGLHIGKKTVLGDGFTVGSPVPSNITTAPLQSSYKPAFGLAITFTKP